MKGRLRREYLLQKENEEKERTIAHNKRILKHCLDNNTELPHELKPKADDLLQEIFYDINDKNLIDGLDSLPQIILPVITTSRDPSDKIKHFAKRLAHILGGTTIQRGNLGIKEMGRYLESSENNALVVVNECRGVPSSISFSIYPYGPTYHFSVFNVKIGEQKITGNAYFIADGIIEDEKKEVEPQISGKNYKDMNYMKNINDEENSDKSKMISEDKACSKVKNLFSRIFSTSEKSLSKGKLNRAILLAKRETFLCFRHYINDEVDSFDLRLYEIVRGTLEGGEKEYVYRPYLNSSRKRE